MWVVSLICFAMMNPCSNDAKVSKGWVMLGSKDGHHSSSDIFSRSSQEKTFLMKRECQGMKFTNQDFHRKYYFVLSGTSLPISSRCVVCVSVVQPGQKTKALRILIFLEVLVLVFGPRTITNTRK